MGVDEVVPAFYNQVVTAVFMGEEETSDMQRK